MENQILRLGKKVATETVRIVYEGEELNQKRAECIEYAGKVQDLEEKKKELVKDLSDEIKGIKATHKVLLGITRNGFEDKNMDVNLQPNDDEGTIEFYDVNSGEYLGKRRQYPHERIFQTLTPNEL